MTYFQFIHFYLSVKNNLILDQSEKIYNRCLEFYIQAITKIRSFFVGAMDTIINFWRGGRLKIFEGYIPDIWKLFDRT